MKIKTIIAILTCGSQTAFRWTQTSTGKSVVGVISGGESNVTAAYHHYANGWSGYYYHTHDMKEREFSYVTAGWHYAGCTPEEIVAFVKKGLKCRTT